MSETKPNPYLPLGELALQPTVSNIICYMQITELVHRILKADQVTVFFLQFLGFFYPQSATALPKYAKRPRDANKQTHEC
jgi:hypothetical protein